MIVSEARREANRKNALKSRGPTTPEGKDRSRRNALDHGFAAEVVHLDEDQAPGAAPERGTTAFDLWLAGEIGLTTRRLDRCRRSEDRLRAEAVLRARDHWDDDRRSEAEALGANLAKDPALVVDRLGQTPQGCDWLIARWTLLARPDEILGKLDDAVIATAFDLLGTPTPLRGLHPGEVIDPSGERPAREDYLFVVARREIDSLKARKVRLAGADGFARQVAIDDLRDEPSAELKRLRRYESRLHRRLAWCLEQLPDDADAHLTLPEPEPTPEPEPAPVVIEPPLEAPPLVRVLPTRTPRAAGPVAPPMIPVESPRQNEPTPTTDGLAARGGQRGVEHLLL